MMSDSRIKVMVAFGTRPEALKLAPVISELRARNSIFRTQVCVTAQHREMLDQVLQLFLIKPDFDLDLMEHNQGLAGFASRALAALDKLFKEQRPDFVVVQGDTTSTFAAALAAFYNASAVAHVEAGLRSFNNRAPFPEEINRRLTTHLADLHFAPTEKARNNLIREGIDTERIWVTGNTIVDTLQFIASRLTSGTLRPPLRDCLPELPSKFVLVTVHRRENHGEGLSEICRALRDLNEVLPDFHFFLPVHPHPQVHGPVNQALSDLPRMHLLPPLDYTSFVWLMQESDLVVSDSGGVQEECCALGKHVLVMREVTERSEAVDSGFARLVGCNKDRLVTSALEILKNGTRLEPKAGNPFGDGRAAERIAATLASHQIHPSGGPEY